MGDHLFLNSQYFLGQLRFSNQGGINNRRFALSSFLKWMIRGYHYFSGTSKSITSSETSGFQHLFPSKFLSPRRFCLSEKQQKHKFHFTFCLRTCQNKIRKYSESDCDWMFLWECCACSENAKRSTHPPHIPQRFRFIGIVHLHKSLESISRHLSIFVMQ